MWIVRLALEKKYTIAVLGLLILTIGAVSIVQIPTGIFSHINIPVVSIIWGYTTLGATLTICIIFVSVLFLEGPAQFLFGS